MNNNPSQHAGVVVENNSLTDIAQAQSEGKTLEQKAGEYVEAENERYKKANCGGMSAEACSMKMYTERREALKEAASLGVDFIPVVGDLKREDPTNSVISAGFGSVGGSGTIAVISDALGSSVKAGASEAISAIGGSLASEAVGNTVKGALDEAEKNNKK